MLYKYQMCLLSSLLDCGGDQPQCEAHKLWERSRKCRCRKYLSTDASLCNVTCTHTHPKWFYRFSLSFINHFKLICCWCYQRSLRHQWKFKWCRCKMCMAYIEFRHLSVVSIELCTIKRLCVVSIDIFNFDLYFLLLQIQWNWTCKGQCFRMSRRTKSNLATIPADTSNAPDMVRHNQRQVSINCTIAFWTDVATDENGLIYQNVWFFVVRNRQKFAFLMVVSVHLISISGEKFLWYFGLMLITYSGGKWREHSCPCVFK